MRYNVLFYAKDRELVAELEMADLPVADDIITINYTRYSIDYFNWIISAGVLQRVEIKVCKIGDFRE